MLALAMVVMPKQPPQDAAAVTRKLDRAKRLRALREVVEGVQAEAARAVGVELYTWNRYETGRGEIGADALARFADIYDVTTDYVLRDDTRGLRREVLIRLMDHLRQSPPAPDARPARPRRVRGRNDELRRS